MSRLLRLGLGAVCAVVLSLSVGPPSAAASQGHREAVASSPGQTVALAVEETAAPSLKSAQVVVQEIEASLVTVAAQIASPPVESEGAAVSAHTSVVAQVAAIEPQEEVAVAEVSPHLLQ